MIATSEQLSFSDYFASQALPIRELKHMNAFLYGEMRHIKEPAATEWSLEYLGRAKDAHERLQHIKSLAWEWSPANSRVKIKKVPDFSL